MPHIPQHNPTDMLVNVKAAAEMLGFAVSTLNNWRSMGTGPPFRKLGRTVRYRVGDLLAWGAEREGPEPVVPEVAGRRRGDFSARVTELEAARLERRLRRSAGGAA